MSGFTAGSGGDAGTWFLVSHNTSRLTVGFEANNFVGSDFGRCPPTSGDFPSADRFSPPDHAAFTFGNAMWID